MAVVSLVICVGQFLLGRRLGKRYGDPVSSGQGLGQKNTILAIWMAQVYLNPIASIAPAAYEFMEFLPKLHARILSVHKLSFYLWAVALTIVTGSTVRFLVEQQDPDYTVEIGLAVVSLVICVGQFLLGRRLGKTYGDPVSSGQGLGQKNTILAIWMAQVYLNPIASIAPAAYVLWQNSINSYQLWLKGRKNE